MLKGATAFDSHLCLSARASQGAFVTNRAAAILEEGTAPQPSSEFYPRVVKYCLDSNWDAPVLTATELEQRLLRFTREKLAAPEFRDAITSDSCSRIVIDSLKVLELIAFLQSALGRKIPTRRSCSRTSGRLNHRASIHRWLARGAPPQASSRGPVPQPSKRSGVAELFARRELELTPDGGLTCCGAAASLCDY